MIRVFACGHCFHAGENCIAGYRTSDFSAEGMTGGASHAQGLAKKTKCPQCNRDEPVTGQTPGRVKQPPPRILSVTVRDGWVAGSRIRAADIPEMAGVPEFQGRSLVVPEGARVGQVFQVQRGGW